MRRTAPKLILQGNQREAKKWIPWATKALERVKNLTVKGIANRVLRPVTGVAVHVRSVNDIDFIRIAVISGGFVCKFPIVPYCAERCSEFQIICRDDAEFVQHPQRLGFEVRTPNGGSTDWDTFDWEFGEGDFHLPRPYSTENYRINYYDTPGQYTVSLRTKKTSVPPFNPGSVTYKSSVNKTGGGVGASGATQALAFAEFTAASFASGGSLAMYKVTAFKFLGSDKWSYEATKAIYTVDLTTIAPADVSSITLRMTSTVFGTPGTEIKSSLGGSGSPLDDDITALAGTSFDVEYSDNNSYADLPAITPNDTSGWQSSGTPSILQTPAPSIVIEYKTTKIIKVNQGRPKETKQIGDTVFEDLSP